MVFFGSTSPFSVSFENGKLTSTSTLEKKGMVGYKLDSPESRNGIFVEYEIGRDELTLSNDKLGMRPVYYRVNGGKVSFSTAMEDLLDEDMTSDFHDAAIAVFLRMGSFIGDSTPFKSIQVMPANSTISYSNGQLDIREHTTDSGSANHLNIAQSREAYGDLFFQAVGKFDNLNDESFALPLSGGRDSRHILLALHAHEMPPEFCITMRHQPPKTDEDARIATLIANELRIKHVIVDQPLKLSELEHRKNKMTNYCSFDHAWIVPMVDFLDAKDNRCIFDGIGGDVLSAGLFLSEKRLALYQSSKWEELANDILGGEGYLKILMNDHYYQRFSRTSAIELLIQELKKFAHLENSISQFYLANRTRRNIALNTWGALSQNRQVLAPFFESELLEFLQNLPAEYILDKQFHHETILERYPKFAHIPYDIGKSNVLPKKVPMISRVGQLGGFFGDVMNSTACLELVDRRRLLTRFVKAGLSGDYYLESLGLFKLMVYLNDFAQLAANKKNRRPNGIAAGSGNTLYGPDKLPFRK